jgi:isoquinoline 1-oxidoreductase subunit beta
LKQMVLDRGAFLRVTARVGTGLGLAFALPAAARGSASASDAVFSPNAWLRIAPDDTITIITSRSEMGQGVTTGMPTLVAEELDVALTHVHVVFAPAAPEYTAPEYGDQLTGGSTSTAASWLPLRQAGASARAMLIAAAAKQWSVDAATCVTSNGSVLHPSSGRSTTYGSLAALAATMPVPANVPLKSAATFTLIGKNHPRLDVPIKVNGTAQYGIDVDLPGMVYAAIARSPVFGGTVKSVNSKKTRAIWGVTDVVQISNGVAVIATNTWSAFQGKLALDITWNDGPTVKRSTPQMFAEAERLGKTHAGERVALAHGNPEKQHGTVREAVYRGPFLAHATMEPMNATAWVRGDACEVWAPNQVQQRGQRFAAKVTGLRPDQCTIHTTYLGGGFGRRLEGDYMQEAVEVSKAIRKPVKVTWTREDDIQHDFYRPMSVNTMRGVVTDGKLTALTTQVVSPSWLRHWTPGNSPALQAAFNIKNGIDVLDLFGAIDAPYDIPNMRVGYIDYEPGIPVGSWRAPDANWNCFVLESFMDEMARASGKDPLAFRLTLMDKHPRAANVLRMAAREAGWGKPHRGFAQGLAVTFWSGSYAATVADVSMERGQPKLHRIVTAIDIGTVVNPDIVDQQAESGTLFGLSAALNGNITIAKGRVQQHNFYDYQVLRMADTPPVDVHVVQSNAKPTGVGEVCTPPIAPAVANAVFVLTNKRVRALPFSEARILHEA